MCLLHWLYPLNISPSLKSTALPPLLPLLVCPNVTSMRLFPANTNPQTVLKLEPSPDPLWGRQNKGTVSQRYPRVDPICDYGTSPGQESFTARLDLRRELILDSSGPYVVKRGAEVCGCHGPVPPATLENGVGELLEHKTVRTLWQHSRYSGQWAGT